MKPPILSIVIPAFREAERIGTTLDELARYLQQQNWQYVEVLVVSAGDVDDTVRIAETKGSKFDNLKVIDLPNRVGKGRDVQHGLLAAKGAYRLFMDADLATPLHHLETIRYYMTENCEIIIGVRDLQTSHTGLRKLISGLGNVLVRTLLGLKISDTQCGFKCFRADVAKDLFSRQTIRGWGFDMEVLAIAVRRGYQITTINLPDWRDVAGGSFSNVAVSGALATFRDLLIIKWNLLRGRYR